MSGPSDPGENLRKRAPVLADVEDRAWREFGEVMRNMLAGPPSEAGPPYVHTFVPPDIDYDGYMPYRAEIHPDTGNAGCYWPIEDAAPGS